MLRQAFLLIRFYLPLDIGDNLAMCALWHPIISHSYINPIEFSHPAIFLTKKSILFKTIFFQDMANYRFLRSSKMRLARFCFPTKKYCKKHFKMTGLFSGFKWCTISHHLFAKRKHQNLFFYKYKVWSLKHSLVKHRHIYGFTFDVRSHLSHWYLYSKRKFVTTCVHWKVAP